MQNKANFHGHTFTLSGVGRKSCETLCGSCLCEKQSQFCLRGRLDHPPLMHLRPETSSGPSGREFAALEPSAHGCAMHTLRWGGLDYVVSCRWPQSGKPRMANRAKRTQLLDCGLRIADWGLRTVKTLAGDKRRRPNAQNEPNLAPVGRGHRRANAQNEANLDRSGPGGGGKMRKTNPIRPARGRVPEGIVQNEANLPRRACSVPVRALRRVRAGRIACGILKKRLTVPLQTGPSVQNKANLRADRMCLNACAGNGL